ncbi:MAG: alpha/beta hydrolase [Clostridia bacterium]|nr:alpha/beta hydrolase [Clostridia bacterium]
MFLDPVLKLFWKNTERMDNKRIATLHFPEGVYESNNHEYLPGGNYYHKLDVYYPEGAEGQLPVIIDVHGGGWMYGDKELNKNYCLTLAKRGYVVFNMSYRLYPEVTADEQLRDVAAALKWINENLDRFPCDKDNICLTGDSAGGMLAGFTAMLSQSEKMRELFSVQDHGIKFNAVGLTSAVGYMDDGSMMSFYTKIMLGGNSYKKEKWAPYVNFDQILELGEMIPTFMVTSTGDTLALKQVLRAAEDFRKKGVEVEMMNFEEKYDGKYLPHVFSILYPESEPSKKNIDAMLAFFKKHSKEKV